jgi:hypothetical protein
MSKALLLGLVALAATGCATGTYTGMLDGSDGGNASPAMVKVSDGVRRCQADGGWYDQAAGVCDHIGGAGDSGAAAD